MRRRAFAALALAIGIPMAIGHAASSRQVAVAAQAAFLERMPDVLVFYGENGAISWLEGRTGIVLPSGMAQFKENEASKELLDHIGPALLAAGTEELRVITIASAEGRSSPERTVKLIEYIRGREVQDSQVKIVLNEQTNEIVLVVADFLPDRGLPQEPKLTAAAARAKVEAAIRKAPLPEERRFTFQDDAANLAYIFEESGKQGGLGGALVWAFSVMSFGLPAQANVDASTGELIGLRHFVQSSFAHEADSPAVSNSAGVDSPWSGVMRRPGTWK